MMQYPHVPTGIVLTSFHSFGTNTIYESSYYYVRADVDGYTIYLALILL
jgi:hypothetical protein